MDQGPPETPEETPEEALWPLGSPEEEQLLLANLNPEATRAWEALAAALQRAEALRQQRAALREQVFASPMERANRLLVAFYLYHSAVFVALNAAVNFAQQARFPESYLCFWLTVRAHGTGGHGARRHAGDRLLCRQSPYERHSSNPAATAAAQRRQSGSRTAAQRPRSRTAAARQQQSGKKRGRRCRQSGSMRRSSPGSSASAIRSNGRTSSSGRSSTAGQKKPSARPPPRSSSA